jgi:hypothetical protein
MMGHEVVETQKEAKCYSFFYDKYPGIVLDDDSGEKVELV